MAETSRPSQGTKPVITSNTPTTAKAKVAAGQPPSGTPVAANSAAPGVDQAMVMGIRWRTER